MSKTLDFLSKRRSVTAKMMKPGHVKNEDLNLILNTGLRVPDHGGLKPWKIIVFKGESRKKFDEEVILREFKANNANPTADMIKIESSRLQSSKNDSSWISGLSSLNSEQNPEGLFNRYALNGLFATCS